MLARLCWKEFRMFWPLWLLVGGCAVGFQWLLLETVREDVRTGMLSAIAFGWVALYACAVGAAAFAGERENGTFLWLDTIPMSRGTVWTGKIVFGLATTLALALVLIVCAAVGTETRDKIHYPMGLIFASVGVVVFEAFAWSLFWSALLNNVLMAAVLSLFSIGAITLAVTGDPGLLNVKPLASHVLWRLLAASVALGFSRAWITRRPQRNRFRHVAVSNSTQGRLLLRPESSLLTTAKERFWKLMSISLIDFRRITLPLRTMRSLAWMTIRESRGYWLLMLGLSLSVTVSTQMSVLAMPLVVFIGIGLMAGLNVFMHENRQRAFGFYVHHGVRPRLVWFTKEFVSFLGFLSLWFVSITVAVCWVSGDPLLGMMRGFSSIPQVLSAPIAGPVFLAVLNAFAIAQLSGLVIRRGITAGVVALLGYLIFLLPQILLYLGRMIPFWSLLLSPILLFVVSWAWSTDWVFDRPGGRRWIKLALLLVVPSCLLVSLYVGYRAWSLPDVEVSLDRSRLRSPSIPPDQNAAELYRVAFHKIHLSPKGNAQTIETQISDVLETGWDSRDEVVEAYWRDNQPVLELTLQAASKSQVLFDRLENMNLFSRLDGGVQGTNQLSRIVALDARERESRGDLKGAWDDIAVIFRMANHVSAPPAVLVQRFTASGIQGTAVTEGMLWASDSRQTPALLRAALSDLKAIPPLSSPGEAIKAEAILVEQTLKLPNVELSPHILKFTGEFLPAHHAVIIAANLAPWERERTGRVLKLATARSLQAVRELLKLDNPPGTADPGPETTIPPISKESLQEALESTPLAKVLLPATESLLMAFQREMTQAHALEQFLALRIWQLEHNGQYPTSLNDLVPSLLDRLPLDPFSGKRFGYVQSKGQSLLPLSLVNRRDQHSVSRTEPTEVGEWLLYSVGPDRIDDRAIISLLWGGKGDLVYPLPPVKHSQYDQKDVK